MDLDYLKSHWASVRQGLNATVTKLNDSDLDERPFPSSRTVRELLLHIAQEEIGERDHGIHRTLTAFPDAFDPSLYPDLASIRSLLERSHQGTVELLESLTPADLSKVIVTPWGPEYTLLEILGHILEHEIHHRGELSLILGLLGREGLNA
ncbi:MAG TPA: DinB family protein [Anaerolineales bacterium]|nr:DinB family protein [Anaerolineales bacterium]